jgi:hypothetical protein
VRSIDIPCAAVGATNAKFLEIGASRRKSFPETAQQGAKARRRVGAAEAAGVYSFLGGPINFERDPLSVSTDWLRTLSDIWKSPTWWDPQVQNEEDQRGHRTRLEVIRAAAVSTTAATYRQ